MKMKYSYPASAFLAILLVVCSSCQSKKNGDGTETQPSGSIPVTYPALGNEEISKLYAATDHVDIIFYKLPVSVNQDDASSAKNTALYVTPAAPNITGQCQPLGRLSWISEGKIIKEADVFVDTGCEYLLFMENNQPVAANAMSKAGVDFFKNIISQVEQRKQ